MRNNKCPSKNEVEEAVLNPHSRSNYEILRRYIRIVKHHQFYRETVALRLEKNILNLDPMVHKIIETIPANRIVPCTLSTAGPTKPLTQRLKEYRLFKHIDRARYQRARINTAESGTPEGLKKIWGFEKKSEDDIEL
ncbi:MAG: hypothetical protein RIC14_07870 [Filomicrobium sp.]